MRGDGPCGGGAGAAEQLFSPELGVKAYADADAAAAAGTGGSGGGAFCGSGGAFCAGAAEKVKAGLRGRGRVAGKPTPSEGAAAGAAAGGGAEKL